MADPTIDLREGGTTVLPASAAGKFFVLEKELDTTIDANNLESGDIAALFSIPKNTRILRVTADVTVAEGAAATVNVGLYKTSDNSAIDADGFFAALNMNAVAATDSGPTLAQDGTTPFAVSITPAYWAGVLTAYDCYLGVAYVSGTKINVAKVTFRAECVQLY